MLATISTSRQLARQVGGNVKCDSGSTVAGATRFVAGVGDATLDGGVRFPDEFSVMAGAFTPGQVLNFRSLPYVADCYGELHLLNEVPPAGNEPSTLLAPPGLLGVDLEVLA